MKHYEDSESIYRKLLARGQQAWDQQSDPNASFEHFLMRPFLERALAELEPLPSGTRALDVGCGTGPIACFLASRGLRVDGIDVSPAAIAEARRQAQQRGLHVNFDVVDICRWKPDRPLYDLIVDGHCLHCLALDEDRQRALAAVRALLRPEGLFLVETMVRWPGMRVGEQYHLDDQGVLWLRVNNPAGHERAQRIVGAWYVPHRRIRSPQAIERDITEAGLDVLWRRVVDQKGPGKPQLMQVRCSPAVEG